MSSGAAARHVARAHRWGTCSLISAASRGSSSPRPRQHAWQHHAACRPPPAASKVQAGDQLELCFRHGVGGVHQQWGCAGWQAQPALQSLSSPRTLRLTAAAACPAPQAAGAAAASHRLCRVQPPRQPAGSAAAHAPAGRHGQGGQRAAADRLEALAPCLLQAGQGLRTCRRNRMDPPRLACVSAQ